MGSTWYGVCILEPPSAAGSSTTANGCGPCDAADPSVFGALSCTCGDASPGSPPCTDDMTDGMQQGLSIQPAVAVTNQ